MTAARVNRKPNTPTARVAGFIEQQRTCKRMPAATLTALSGWGRQNLTTAMHGGAVGFQPLADMLEVFGFHLVVEAKDDLLPLSLNEMRAVLATPPERNRP